MSLILFQKGHHIATITLNSPDKLNALCVASAREFSKYISQIKKDQTVKAVVITGAGRAFSSGGNLDMIFQKFKTSALKNRVNLIKFYNMFLSVRSLSQPVIAAINGPAVGAGLCLALACDLRYASPHAKLGINFAKTGLAPGMGTAAFLTKMAGPTAAADMLYFGKTLSAEEALQHQLINGIFNEHELLDQCLAKAEELTQNSPLALKYIKQGLYQAIDQPLSQMLKFDAKAQAKTFASKDVREGFKAIKEKRKPQFHGC